ncbi:hypothetical protein NE237_023688 [Protea cynaroides]|uniref:Exopolygalacturonase n=1 Tax=Protea cynaroides TaxID=273540 RepID=A0A9Q0HDB2_9MAGN|nr:hypothetical protein NE237_023688 [Protea cynaroides]
MRPDLRIILFLFCFISFIDIVNGGRVGAGTKAGGGKTNGQKQGASPPKQSGGTFDVKSYGAKGDGRNDDSKAFTAAWKAACGSSGTVKLVVPKGTFLLGPVKFVGPCKTVDSITVQMQGFLKATSDLSRYGSSDDWIEFGWVEGLTLTGGGTFDGQGAASWPFNKCPSTAKCKLLPTNVKFVQMTNTVVKGLTSLNSKFFHIAVLDCKNFKASGIRISAPGNSPNTDGIHLERNTDVSISQSVIGTGDDCISVGQGNSDISITGVSCGPGHGISVGSLGKYKDEGDVTGLVVKDCTLTGTMNGIRIKTWANSPDTSVASNMTFEDIVMNNVANPIIIDQTYCPYTTCASMAPSRVKLSDIFFKNIRGTSSSPVAVTLECSKGIPCQNVNLHDVHLDLTSGGTVAKSACNYVEAKYSGTQIPPPCTAIVTKS